MAEVQRVLREIGAADIPQVLVFNKLDALVEARRPHQLVDIFDLNGVQTPRIFLSAKNGEGLQDLRSELARIVMAGTLPEGIAEDFPESHVASLEWAQFDNETQEKKR